METFFDLLSKKGKFPLNFNTGNGVTNAPGRKLMVFVTILWYDTFWVFLWLFIKLFINQK